MNKEQEKKEREKYVFESFKELYNDFPEGVIIPGEKPDYLINSNDRIIGVEITQVFIDNFIGSELNEKRKENIRSMLGDLLCNKIKTVVPYKFVLDIEFSNKDFSTNHIERIALACEEYIRLIEFPKEIIESFDIENYGQLPDEIININLLYFPSLDKSFFSEISGGVVPNLAQRHLKCILDKKEAALKNYRFCHEYWLLIKEGTFYSDSFNKIDIEEIETTFEKIFIYRHSQRKVVQLK